jgi:phosphoglycerate dehydrogenase-like enzyme
VLAEADFAVLALPITRDTVALVDDAALAVMKPTASLISVARGDPRARAYAARCTHRGTARGFAADVWWHLRVRPAGHLSRPGSITHGNTRLPNVLATGNQASHTLEIRTRCLAMGAENQAAFARGEAMPRTVDLDLGY